MLSNECISDGDSYGPTRLAAPAGVGAAAAAAGSAANATIKATAGMPIAQRAGLVAGSAFVTSTQLGLKVGTALFNQSSISDNTKNIKPTDVDNVPSPDSSFINCVCLHNRKR